MLFISNPVATSAIGTLPPAFVANEGQLPEQHSSFTGWSNETVDSVGSVGYYSGVGYALDGNPAIAYSDSTNDDVKYAHWNGSSWNIEVVDAGKNVYENVVLAFEPANGHPAIAYGTGTLKCARWTGSSWSITTVDKPIGHGKMSIKFGPDGQPWISYNGNLPSVKVAHFTGAAWTKETVDAAMGGDSSIGFTPAGQPAVAYQAGTGVRYAVKSGTNWTGEWVESGVSGYGVFVSLGFDGSGVPAIAHGSGTPSGGVRFLRRSGTSWGPAELITDSQGRSPRMTYDAQGTAWVVVTYGSSPSYSLLLLQRTSVGWITETVIPPGGNLTRADLAFDAVGNPAISVGTSGVNRDDLLFARRLP